MGADWSSFFAFCKMEFLFGVRNSRLNKLSVAAAQYCAKFQSMLMHVFLVDAVNVFCQFLSVCVLLVWDDWLPVMHGCSLRWLTGKCEGHWTWWKLVQTLQWSVWCSPLHCQPWCGITRGLQVLALMRSVGATWTSVDPKRSDNSTQATHFTITKSSLDSQFFLQKEIYWMIRSLLNCANWVFLVNWIRNQFYHGPRTWEQDRVESGCICAQPYYCLCSFYKSKFLVEILLEHHMCSIPAMSKWQFLVYPMTLL